MFFEHLKLKSHGLMNNIFNLPFNVELADGSLPLNKFIFYLQQDAIYLSQFANALAITATRLPDQEAREQFIKFSNDAITHEQSLQLAFIQQFKQHINITPTPTCFMYTNYILKMAKLAPIAEAVASLLPCFYVYYEVGKHLAQLSTPSNPYSFWIETYNSQVFEQSVLSTIDIFNQLCKETTHSQQQQVSNAFMMATKLEWLFWQSAYELEKWPV